jgi:hypothetical protein
MSQRSTLLVLVTGLVASWPGSGHAYSDPSRFGEAVQTGGGDGRWFTGSPADGFSCNVCHDGQQGLEITVRSVPQTYLPGQTYEIVVAWGDPLAMVAANLEITNELGQALGELSAPPASALQPADECEPKGQGIGASRVFLLPDGRQVLGFAECGANQVRVQWTAPTQAAGAAFLSGAVVLSNHDETLQGDGVTVLARTMLAPGQEAIDTRATGGCSVTGLGAPRSISGLLFAAGAALGLGVRRVSTRRARSA